jgi:DNA-binding NarL/FixJ family response regulator
VVSTHDAVRVFVVDDHAVVRRGLRSYFQELDDITLVGEAVDGRAALDELRTLNERALLPDVVLVDLVMRRLDGMGLIAELKQRYPSVDVIVVTSFSETHRIRSALDAGASGYVLKDADPDEIYEAVLAVRHGEVHLDPVVAEKLAGSGDDSAGLAALTPREREILVLLGHGRSNRAISRSLHITERTVTMHLTNIFAKIGVVSRMQAALWAVRQGLVTMDS